MSDVVAAPCLLGFEGLLVAVVVLRLVACGLWVVGGGLDAAKASLVAGFLKSFYYFVLF